MVVGRMKRNGGSPPGVDRALFAQLGIPRLCSKLALRVEVGICSRIRNDFNCHVGLRAGTVDDWDRVCHNFCTVELDTQKGDTREPSHSKGAREP